mgnify:CR=1 FL=1
MPDIQPFEIQANEHDLEMAMREMQAVIAGEAVPVNEPVENVEYVNQTEGKFILSPRRFGVEFEVNLGRVGQNELRGLIAREFGMVHDGSVNAGIEIVSPILGGSAGENQIIKTCKALEAVKAGADESCGMHVHLDAPEFYNHEKIPVYTVRQAIKLAQTDGYKGATFSVLHRSVIQELKATDLDLYHKLINDRQLDTFSFSAWEAFARPLNAHNLTFSGVDYVPERGRFYMLSAVGSRGTRMPFNESLNTKEKVRDYRGEPTLIVASYDHHALVDPEASQNDLVIMVNKNRAKEEQQLVARLKRVAAFYVAFDDIIASMLPCDRRDNDYSKRINVRMSMVDVTRVDTLLDFFNLWTKTKSLNQFQNSLREQRHESRYYGINFRSLIKHGTIEIRYHAGTTDAVKTLHWVVLHQKVMDIAADLNNARFDMERLEKAAMIIDIDAKTDLFFKKLGLSGDTEKFYRARIKALKKEDANFVESLIADDN